jgi:glycosyltransferase involved in cell wall biosynthesis
MKIAIVGLNRFDHPTGVCICISNLVKSISKNTSIELNILIGDWQEKYYCDILKLNTLERVNLIVISIQNTSVSRNRWFLTQMREEIGTVDFLLLAYPIPILKYQFRKIKVISIIHDLYQFDYSRNFGFPFYYLNRLQFYFNLFNSDAFICVSKTTFQSLNNRFKKYLKSKLVEVIYNIVPEYIGNYEDFNSNIITNNFWLSVAQHRPNKNLDLVIQSFADISRSGLAPKDLKLVIVGTEGPTTLALKALVTTEKLTGDVYFFQGLKDEQLHWLYKNNVLFLMTSSIEGFGLPLIESARYNNRIVASNIPIFKELVNGVNFFDVNSKDINVLKKVILQTLEMKSMPIKINPDLADDNILNKFILLLDKLK